MTSLRQINRTTKARVCGQEFEIFDFGDSNTAILLSSKLDNFTEKELCEAQDTVLYHLGNCSEFCISERDIITYFRVWSTEIYRDLHTAIMNVSIVLQGLSSHAKYILSPFLISALLTMCKINRNLDSARLSSSTTLQFLRSVIRNNERERELCSASDWCRMASDDPVVDIEKIYTILIDQR